MIFNINTSELILGFLTAFFLVLLATPSLIKVAKLKHLVDEPSEARKMHKRRTPTIGGIIIFSAILFAYSIWFPDANMNEWVMSNALREYKYIVACLIILFFIGVKDDIIGTAPVKKLMAHILVALILVIMAKVQIKSMHGLFGLDFQFPDYGAIFLSIFVYIVIVNAFNLIDGLDGLAAGIGTICGLFFGTYFIFTGSMHLALLSFILCGALLGFMVFNFSPAKLFMGDSGSLTIGAILCILALRSIETPIVAEAPGFVKNINPAIFAMSVLVYPLMDTFRVFLLRALKGQSPFLADRNHLHHKIHDIGFSHAKTVFILYGYNILVVILGVVLCQFLNPTLQFLFLFGIAFALAMIPVIIHKKQREAKKNKSNLKRA